MNTQTIVAVVLGFVVPCAIFIAAAMQASQEKREQGGW